MVREDHVLFGCDLSIGGGHLDCPFNLTEASVGNVFKIDFSLGDYAGNMATVSQNIAVTS